jgi:transcriptional regulator with XRE-family HTH domain
MDTTFSDYLREKRQALRAENRRFSVRQVAMRVRIEPSYLSKIERGLQAPPSEKTIRALAEDLREDPDVLLALAGKVAKDVQDVIRTRPRLLAPIIRRMKELPDAAVLCLVREVCNENG